MRPRHFHLVPFALLMLSCALAGGACDRKPEPAPAVRSSAAPASASAPASAPGPAGRLLPKRPSVGAHEGKLAVGGVERAYTYVIPPGYNHLLPMPLLVILRGEDGNPEIPTEGKRALLAGIHRAAMVAVLPEAHGAPKAGDAAASWNTGRCGDSATDGADDVAFLRALIPALRTQLVIDLKRVYVVGYGSGASLAHRAAAELGRDVTAIVAVGGRLGCKADVIAPPAEPVSAMIVHGAKDRRYPYQGGIGRTASGKMDTWDSLSAADALAYWKLGDGCSQPAWRTKSADGTSTRESYACAGGTETVLITEAGLGHAWPDKIEGMPAMRTVTEFLRGKRRD